MCHGDAWRPKARSANLQFSVAPRRLRQAGVRDSHDQCIAELGRLRRCDISTRTPIRATQARCQTQPSWSLPESHCTIHASTATRRDAKTGEALSRDLAEEKGRPLLQQPYLMWRKGIAAQNRNKKMRPASSVRREKQATSQTKCGPDPAQGHCSPETCRFPPRPHHLFRTTHSTSRSTTPPFTNPLHHRLRLSCDGQKPRALDLPRRIPPRRAARGQTARGLLRCCESAKARTPDAARNGAQARISAQRLDHLGRPLSVVC